MSHKVEGDGGDRCAPVRAAVRTAGALNCGSIVGCCGCVTLRVASNLCGARTRNGVVTRLVHGLPPGHPAQRPREGMVRIGFLMGRSFTEDRHQADIVTWLRQWGATAEPLHLGDDLIDVARVSLDHDLFVLKSRSDLAMSVAADLHGAGARLLNQYPVSALLRDRVVTFRVLRAAGVPVPETFAASHVSQLLPALDRGPLIIKPYRRYKKHGTEVVTNAAELAALGSIELVFAQRYHPPDGPDRTVYSIGSELFGVLHAGPDASFALSPELVDIARRCGTALGIDLFGVNVVMSGGRAYVVDMSSFPGFRGVPEAARRVAKYVHAAAERALCGEPVVPAELQRTAGRAATHRALKGSS